MNGDERSKHGRPEQYEPPQVEQIQPEDGPVVTAAGDSPPSDGVGPEWKPSDPPVGSDS